MSYNVAYSELTEMLITLHFLVEKYEKLEKVKAEDKIISDVYSQILKETKNLKNYLFDELLKNFGKNKKLIQEILNK